MILWWAADAWAHSPGLSYALVEDGSLSLTFSRPELAVRFPMGDLDAASLLLAEATVDRAVVQVDGVDCLKGALSLRAVEADGVEIGVSLVCPAGEVWTLQAGYLDGFAPGHRHYVEAFGQPVAVLSVGDDLARFDGESSTGDIAVQFGALGVEHILGGYDHLAFLLGLLVVARSFREMAGIVTGFTLAHSVTLSLSALGIVRLSGDVVEPLIALSIVLVGIENFFEPPPKRRFAITFALGLLHGFGFAGALAGLGVPRGSAAVALLSFNLGVELGQFSVVAVVLPLLLFLRRYPSWRSRGIPVASAAIALAGAIWLVQRLGFG